ncbi:MAG: hypothetical protein WBF58_15395, partial [Xanthobacteraceae bacterium]
SATYGVFAADTLLAAGRIWGFCLRFLYFCARARQSRARGASGPRCWPRRIFFLALIGGGGAGAIGAGGRGQRGTGSLPPPADRNSMGVVPVFSLLFSSGKIRPNP